MAALMWVNVALMTIERRRLDDHLRNTYAFRSENGTASHGNIQVTAAMANGDARGCVTQERKSVHPLLAMEK